MNFLKFAMLVVDWSHLRGSASSRSEVPLFGPWIQVANVLVTPATGMLAPQFAFVGGKSCSSWLVPKKTAKRSPVRHLLWNGSQ